MDTNLDSMLWDLQRKFNQQNSEALTNVWNMFSKLLNIIEDQEKDMIKMTDRINELTKKLNEIEGK